MFWRNMPLPSSGSKNKTREKPAGSKQSNLLSNNLIQFRLLKYHHPEFQEMPLNALLLFSTNKFSHQPYWLLLMISIKSTRSSWGPCWAWDRLSNVTNIDCCKWIKVQTDKHAYVTHYENFLFFRNPYKGLSFPTIAVLCICRAVSCFEVSSASLSLSPRPISCITKKHPDLWRGFASKVMQVIYTNTHNTCSASRRFLD
jgi:hypothetical protein